jgi:hypothetical protein
MSTFEALKIAYVKSTGKEEPGVLALLAFGSISGSVGATSVYPLNLVRTRLQASGSSGHPQRYTGVWEVMIKTWEKDGWRGFYRGLFPTLAKVGPFSLACYPRCGLGSMVGQWLQPTVSYSINDRFRSYRMLTQLLIR